MKSKIQIINKETLAEENSISPFFSSAGQRKATKALSELLKGSLDLVYITGDLGTGKTRLLDNYISNIGSPVKTAVIRERLDSPMEFLHALAVSYDGVIHGETTQELHASVIDFLIEQHIQGEQFVLAIDNAQQLSDEVFDLIQSLSELESRDKRILKILFLARNGAKINRKIRELSASSDLSALACEITPFTEIETRAYVSEKLSRTVEFTRLQLTTTGGRRIHYYSGGNPLLVNILTEISGNTALSAEQSQITRKIVQHAVQTHRWVSISEAIPSIHIVKVPGSDERGQYSIPKVILFEDNRKISEHEITDEKTWIGRDASSSIRLNQQSVSRRHALVTKEGDNVWISNLNSINGTQVNSKAVLRRVLLDGDVIRVANFLLLFVYEEAAHSSGHLKEATQNDAGFIEEDLNEDVDNYIELPTRSSNDDAIPAYQAPHPAPAKGRKTKTPLLTVSTIASIGLITGAIVISQNGMEKFDISFPKGGSIEPEPKVVPVSQLEEEISPVSGANEIISNEPISNEPISNEPAPNSPISQDSTAAKLTVSAPTEEQSRIATEADTGLAGLAVETSPEVALAAAGLPPAPTPPEATNNSIVTPAPLTNAVPVTASTPVESLKTESIPTFQPVEEILSPQVITADTEAFITDSQFTSGEQSEAGFQDLMLASPGTENLYVKDDLKYDNPTLLSDRRYDSVEFDWNDIDQLLQLGQQQIASLKLTIPAGDNAYDTYKSVLALDPGNAEALQGLEFIAERYSNLATASKERFNFSHALKMANRGLEVVPDHAQLLSLQDELTVLAENSQRKNFAIEQVSETELKQRYQIAKVPESELNQGFNIARVSEGEIDELYSAGSGTQFIEPLQAPRSFSSITVDQPVFVTQETTISQPVVTTYVAPEPVVTQPRPTVVVTPTAIPQMPTVSANVPQPAPQVPVVAVAPPAAQSVEQVATTPTQAPVATVAPIASAPQNKVIPDYLKSGSASAAVQSPKAAPVSPDTILNVDHLLKKAARLQSIGHYTGPAGENALDTYKRILTLEPMNPDALIGLLDIADYYHRESEKLMLLGDPLSSLAMIEQGLKVRPDHKGLRQLQTNAQLLLEKEGKERGIGNKRLSTSERKSAKASRHIEKLVTDARDRLNEKEYSKSLSIIEQGLKLDPDNPELISIRSEALQSLAHLEKKWGQEQKLREQNLARQQRVKYEVNEKKAQRLLEKARKDYTQGNYQAALKSTRTGLIVMPENLELIALQKKIEKQWDKTTKTQANKAVNSVVSGLVAKAKTTHATGNSAETLKLIETGLTLDPGNVDLRVMKLEIEKTEEINALKRQADAKVRELEALKRQASN